MAVWNGADDAAVDKMAPNLALTESLPQEGISDMISDRHQLPTSLCNLSEEELDKMKRHLVRKLDMRLMGPLILMYIMNYLDRNAIAAAKISGIVEDLDLSDSQYQTCVSILFVGYILMQVPSNLFLNKIGRPCLYLPTCMMIWGVLCACAGAVHGFGGLLATRFLLGFIEAAYFVSDSALQSSHRFPAMGLASWRWLFIIEGSMTVAIALLALFVLPDFPINTRWISPVERDLATWRLYIDVGQEDWVDSRRESLWDGLKLCLHDPKTFIGIPLIFGVVSSGTISSYFPTVVSTLGYNHTKTLLLTAPPYLLSCIGALGVCLNADRTGERYLHFTLPVWVSVAGFVISASTLNVPARYFSMMIMLPGIYTAFTLGLTWMANTMPRPPAKRAALLALCNACSNCSSVYGPFMYPDWQAPRFIIAMCVNAGTALMSIAVATGFRFHLVRLNRQLDIDEGFGPNADGEADAGPQQGGTAEKGFRYLY
ncbi:hypothetical protein ABEF92_006889 [Exophiala dermatitidis]